MLAANIVYSFSYPQNMFVYFFYVIVWHIARFVSSTLKESGRNQLVGLVEVVNSVKFY